MNEAPIHICSYPLLSLQATKQEEEKICVKNQVSSIA